MQTGFLSCCCVCWTYLWYENTTMVRKYLLFTLSNLLLQPLPSIYLDAILDPPPSKRPRERGGVFWRTLSKNSGMYSVAVKCMHQRLGSTVKTIGSRRLYAKSAYNSSDPWDSIGSLVPWWTAIGKQSAEIAMGVDKQMNHEPRAQATKANVRFCDQWKPNVVNSLTTITLCAPPGLNAKPQVRKKWAHLDFFAQTRKPSHVPATMKKRKPARDLMRCFVNASTQIDNNSWSRDEAR